jgi:hypothetical protein
MPLRMKICERVNKYIGSTSFQNRYEVLKTKPAPASLAELSVKVGVPLWIMTAPPEQTDAWPIGENVAPVHSDVEIETTIVALGREPGGGLVVMPDVFTSRHRAPIILAAARNNLPAVYWQPDLARDGGLLSYGIDRVDIFRRAASYVDRILRGRP